MNCVLSSSLGLIQELLIAQSRDDMAMVVVVDEGRPTTRGADHAAELHTDCFGQRFNDNMGERSSDTKFGTTLNLVEHAHSMIL